MLLPESPKALAIDGSLASWGVFVVAHGAAAMISGLTITILLVRLMILIRQWRRG